MLDHLTGASNGKTNFYHRKWQKHERIPVLSLALCQTDEGKRAARGRCKYKIIVTKDSLNLHTAARQTLKWHVHFIRPTLGNFSPQLANKRESCSFDTLSETSAHLLTNFSEGFWWSENTFVQRQNQKTEKLKKKIVHVLSRCCSSTDSPGGQCWAEQPNVKDVTGFGWKSGQNSFSSCWQWRSFHFYVRQKQTELSFHLKPARSSM